MAVLLVVDDDAEILELTANLLASTGYEVLSVSRADEALAILEGTRPVDLLITDVVMPGQSGFDLANRARRLRPALRVLYVSGYVGDTDEILGPDGPLLCKPWHVNELLSVVEASLRA